MTEHTPKPDTAKKKPDQDRKDAVDDAMEIAELLAEEATGIGITKRLWQRGKKIVGKEYLEEISALKTRQNELLETNNVLTRMSGECVKRIDELEAKVNKLKDENEALRRQNSELLDRLNAKE